MAARRSTSGSSCLKWPHLWKILIVLAFLFFYVEYFFVIVLPEPRKFVTDVRVPMLKDVTAEEDHIQETPPPPKKLAVENVDVPGPIQHGPSNLCLHPKGGGTSVSEKNPILMFSGCFGEDRLKYRLTSKGEIKHELSGKCLIPASDNMISGTDVMLSSNCEKSRFSISKGDIKHMPSGMCLHVKGGMRAPNSGTSVVLHKGCGLERNQFNLITQDPVNLAKQIEYGKRVTDANRPKKVALSILITKDPGPRGGFIDSAATLVQSVKQAKSRYNIELVAIVSKDVVKCRYSLERLGFKILEKDLPVKPDEIRNPQIAKEILTDGCCGIWELLKLHAWTLTEYDRVLQLDTDIMFHQNFDELFEYDTTLVWTHGALGGTERLNGGFLVVRPNLEHYDEMVEIIKSGDFRGGSGWRGKCCWVYGGRTIQGILPYYYLYEQMSAQQEVDRCKYNNMVEIDRCKTWRFENVTSNHFTVCQKPFHCTRSRNKLCKAFTEQWWIRSHEVEESLGLPKRRECGGRYEPLALDTVPKEKVLYR
mmetsp:Transcript_12506/g.18671  ORF Transcript_12506/g.18671 Transcript_12506/m.18671 type:complete len:535 (+) Transcript_12506:14-1618(+)